MSRCSQVVFGKSWRRIRENKSSLPPEIPSSPAELVKAPAARGGAEPELKQPRHRDRQQTPIQGRAQERQTHLKQCDGLRAAGMEDEDGKSRFGERWGKRISLREKKFSTPNVPPFGGELFLSQQPTAGCPTHPPLALPGDGARKYGASRYLRPDLVEPQEGPCCTPCV